MALPTAIYPEAIYNGGIIISEGADIENDNQAGHNTDYIPGSSINRLKSEIKALEEELGPSAEGALKAGFDSLAERLLAFLPGGNKQFIQTITDEIVWANDGTLLENLNASNLSAGTVPLDRLDGITTEQLSPSAGILSTQLATIAEQLGTAGHDVAGTYSPLSIITVNAQGQIIAASSALMIDVSSLPNSGVTAGLYKRPKNLTVDVKGRITSPGPGDPALSDTPIDLAGDATEITGILPLAKLPGLTDGTHGGNLTVAAGAGLIVAPTGGIVTLGGTVTLALPEMPSLGGAGTYGGLTYDKYGRIATADNTNTGIGQILFKKRLYEASSAIASRAVDTIEDGLVVVIPTTGTWEFYIQALFTCNPPDVGVRAGCNYTGTIYNAMLEVGIYNCNPDTDLIPARRITILKTDNISTFNAFEGVLSSSINNYDLGILKIHGIINALTTGQFGFSWGCYRAVGSGPGQPSLTIYPYSFIKLTKVAVAGV